MSRRYAPHWRNFSWKGTLGASCSQKYHRVLSQNSLRYSSTGAENTTSSPHPKVRQPQSRIHCIPSLTAQTTHV
ncbi:hypothetical protein L596_025395 [Steinernema carpocapsae]|uniref:Uncharacterized protein n=1 Tax=Steinernema carpocapsae TaxID=34508 RepID=A0A4U5M8H6_STECR|nr:hypothetical protein L596_025395 [Steinernema carpocapsae]